MPVYKMRIAFNGRNYAGWQKQPGLHTVQQAVEDTLRSIFQESGLGVTASGRTDAGVHALDMTVSFRTETELPEEEAAAKLKQRLPHDIRLLKIEHAPPGFNAHKDALGKAYVYVICPGEPEIFLKDLCWNWVNKPITEEVRKAVKLLAGKHDFRSFTGRHTEGDTVRTVYRAELTEIGNLVCFYISGNGFLYKMVRRLTGFLYETAQGKHTAEDLKEQLEHPEIPADDATVAPPEGLYLQKVFYQEDEWNGDRPASPEPLCRFGIFCPDSSIFPQQARHVKVNLT